MKRKYYLQLGISPPFEYKRAYSLDKISFRKNDPKKAHLHKYLELGKFKKPFFFYKKGHFTMRSFEFQKNINRVKANIALLF